MGNPPSGSQSVLVSGQPGVPNRSSLKLGILICLASLQIHPWLAQTPHIPGNPPRQPGGCGLVNQSPKMGLPQNGNTDLGVHLGQTAYIHEIPPAGSQGYGGWPTRGPRVNCLNTENSGLEPRIGQTQYIPGNQKNGSQGMRSGLPGAQNRSSSTRETV